MPIKEQRPFTLWGGGRDDKMAIQWGLAYRVPWDQIQPRMVVDFGQMMVLVGDKQRLKWSGESSTRLQLNRCVSGELLPQQRSSASLVTQPSWIRSLRTQHIISSRVASAPGIPIAHNYGVHTVPRKGVAMPQYFRED